GLTSMDSVIGLESKLNERSGEFGAGAELTPKLVEMATAVGMTEAELEDLGKAAGDMIVNLKKAGMNVEDATKETAKVMLAGVGQSTIGSITMGDMAKNAPKFLATAGRIGGDASENMGRTIALANYLAPSMGSVEVTATGMESL